MRYFLAISKYLQQLLQDMAWHIVALSHRDIEGLPAEPGIEVSYESVRLWCNKFGLLLSKRLKRKHLGFGDTFCIDEVFGTIKGNVPTCGELWIKTVTSSMCICSRAETAKPRNELRTGRGPDARRTPAVPSLPAWFRVTVLVVTSEGRN